MKLNQIALALALTVLAGGANAALTSSETEAGFFTSLPTAAMGTDSFIGLVVTGSTSEARSFSSGVFTDRVNATYVTTTFTFDNPVSAFGGIWDLTYYNNIGGPGSGITIKVGSDTFSLDTAKQGFFGVKDTSNANSITSFSVTYASLSPFQETYQLSGLGYTTAAAVPEPETYAMMLAGLAALSAVARRRKQA